MTREVTSAFLGLSAMLAVLIVFYATPARCAPTVPDYVAAAVADPARPPDQVAWDAARKPAQVLQFAGVQPGARVADFMSGGAYFTRIFSRVVGKTGHVYAFVPEEQLKNCAPEETDGTRALEHDARYSNVSVVRGPVDQFRVPEALDLVWTSLNFHDLFDPFMGPANVPTVTQSIFQALKPGGVFLVIDHVAQPGSEIRDTNTLHRIDAEVIIRQAQMAGFQLEAQSDLLRNRRDTHELRVFDTTVRGHTDQVILKFRKPSGASADFRKDRKTSAQARGAEFPKRAFCRGVCA